MESTNADAPGSPLLTPLLVARSWNNLHQINVQSSVAHESINLTAGKESHMITVEKPGRFVSPIAVQQRSDDAVVAYVWNACHNPPARRKPITCPREQAFGILQVLRNVPADDAVK